MKPFAHTYTRLILAGIGTAVAVALLGYFPTVRIAGADAIGAMVAGIAVSLVAGCAGAVPIALAAQGDPAKTPQAILTATAIRFLLALALTVSVVFSGWFDRVVLGMWVGLSYLAMLMVDTMYAVHVVAKTRGRHP